MPKNTPVIVVESDYDGYFEGMVRGMVKAKVGEFKHKKIVVTAGPYRPNVVTSTSDGDTIHLDFYSAFRAGFGSLPNEEYQQLVAEL